MPKQASGGNKKRKRRPRATHKILAQENRKAKWLRRLKVDPKAQRSKKRVPAMDFSHENVEPLPHIRPTTFDIEYKKYRITKGRHGLNPSPEHRQDENPWVTHHFWCSSFPIGELMEKPMRYPKAS